MLLLNLHSISTNPWTSDIQWNSDIKVVRECFPFDDSELSQMIAMIWCVYDVGVL